MFFRVSMLVFGFCFFLGLSGVRGQATAAEQELGNLEGTELIKAAVRLARSQLAEGRWEAALESARIAQEQAAKLNIPYAEALGAYWEGKAMVESQSSDEKALKKVLRKLEEGNVFLAPLPDPEFKQANLELTRALAQMLGDSRLVAEIELDLEALKGAVETEPAEPEIAPAAAETIDPPGGVVRIEGRNEFSNLLAENRDMEVQLEQYRRKVDSLDAQRLRTELVNAQLRIRADSLLMQSRLDSFSLAQQTLLVNRQKAERNLIFIIGGLVLLIATVLLIGYLRTRETNAALAAKNMVIEEERKRSEDLLLNILPKAIAGELKEKGKVAATIYPETSILFADFEKFSQIILDHSPEKMIQELDLCFSAFDRITGKYGLEKIKTIGDAYMAVGGVPHSLEDHAAKAVKVATEMLEFIHTRHREAAADLPKMNLRIGIHTGPVIAGVVGLKKFAYDVWGDSVNLAARMEEAGIPGKINISAETYQRLNGHFECTHRGKIAAKNIGDLDMYLVKP